MKIPVHPLQLHPLSACLALLLSLVLAPLSFSAEVTLAWDPNSEADLAGYGVYYRQEADGPPYDLHGYVALAELGDRAAPVFTVEGLEKGARYYFAVTAYDTLGHESGFSNSACGITGDKVRQCDEAEEPEPGDGITDTPSTPDPLAPPLASPPPADGPAEPPPDPPGPAEPLPVDPFPVAPPPDPPAPVSPPPAQPGPAGPPPAEPGPARPGGPDDRGGEDPADDAWSWDVFFEELLAKLLEWLNKILS